MVVLAGTVAPQQPPTTGLAVLGLGVIVLSLLATAWFSPPSMTMMRGTIAIGHQPPPAAVHPLGEPASPSVSEERTLLAPTAGTETRPVSTTSTVVASRPTPVPPRQPQLSKPRGARVEEAAGESEAGGRRLPNGGPSEVYLGGWDAVNTAFRPAGPDEPIPFMIDWSVVGCARQGASSIAPLLTRGTKAEAETLVRRVLSRTRLGAVVCFRENTGSAGARAIESALRRELEHYAPAWRIVEAAISPLATEGSSNAVLVAMRIERRARLFVFAIAGGTDGRAAYVERTWGRRTPVQWFADRWEPSIRPIVDLHPHYQRHPFDMLTFKITRIWQRVFQDFGPATARTVATAGLARAQTYHPLAKAFRAGYDWYVRLWDDNYFYEENIANILVRLPPPTAVPQLAGKVLWRVLGRENVSFPFAGGGAGWFMSSAALTLFGPSVPDAESWMPAFRLNPLLYLPRHLHDEDVVLSRWLFMLKKVRFVNIPGVEHVSPGMKPKQRCMSKEELYQLRWDRNATAYFNYFVFMSRDLQIEQAGGASVKPSVWHYMTPRRLTSLETLLYPERTAEFPPVEKVLPTTMPDVVTSSKSGAHCYPPTTPQPGHRSVFESVDPDPPVQWQRAGGSGG